MAKVRDKIEEEIRDLKMYLKRFERHDYDERKWSKELRELRHWTIYVHSSIENYMEFVLGEFLFPKLNPRSKQQKEEFVTEKIIFENHAYLVLDELEYHNKTKAIEKFNLIPGELLSHIRGVNTIRNNFSHPSAHVDDLVKYNDRKIYLKELKFLIDTLNDTVDHLVENYPNFADSSKI